LRLRRRTIRPRKSREILMQPQRKASGEDIRAELFELIRTRSFGRGKIKLASGRERLLL
jgi:hypothetical protein